nr:hypothetical protein Q903MT_gene6142 [Picea sitchensis]
MSTVDILRYIGGLLLTVQVASPGSNNEEWRIKTPKGHIKTPFSRLSRGGSEASSQGCIASSPPSHGSCRLRIAFVRFKSHSLLPSF